MKNIIQKTIHRILIIPLLFSIYESGLKGQTILKKSIKLDNENIIKKDPYNIRMIPGFSIKADVNPNIYFQAIIGNKDNPNDNIINIDPSYNITSNENYIYKRTYLTPIQTTTPSANQKQSITYYDGLGRSKQNVSIKSSPKGKDLVSYTSYNINGQKVENWLPVPMISKHGSIQEDVKNEILNYYSTEFHTNDGSPEKVPYSKKILDASPLNKITEVIGTGQDWSGNSSKLDYATNNGTDVFRFIANSDYSTGIANTSLSGSDYYPPGELLKYTIKDEDQNEIIVFKNSLGQKLLERKNDGTSFLDTYYIYNEYDQLAYIITPKAVEELKANPKNNSLINNLCYQYQYDDKKRLIAKRIPGKGDITQNDGWEYFVYDKQERIIASQNPVLRKTNEWLFVKYDQFDRVVYIGLKTGHDRASEQSLANSISNNNTLRDDQNGFNWNGLIVHYKNEEAQSYPNAINKLLAVNYYDAHPSEAPEFTSVFASTQLTSNPAHNRNTKGLLVASYVNMIDSNEWMKSYSWYDNDGRLIINEIKSPSGGRTRSERKLRFSGAPEQIITWHNRNGASDIQIKERFNYDHQERLIKQYHQVNEQPEELLGQYVYGELGNVTNKVVGNNLQNITYKYNIRGQLTHINDPQDISDKLFAMQIRYNNPVAVSNAKARFNGNISQIDWSSQSTDGILKRYTFDYDGVNRLKSAKFWDEINMDRNTFSESLTYDLNGNINTLKRQGGWQGSSAENIDDLKYYYDGNKLKNIEEIGLGNLQNGYHLPPYTMGKNIEYDINGNMTKHEDNNITNIKYNVFDLPKQISYNGSIINFAYLADGTKIKKNVGNTITEYLDGFQYENGILQFFPTSEGYYDVINGRYVYNYNDLNNNVRVSYYRGDKQQSVILSDKDYYPFGLEHSTGFKNNPNYQYTYQGQEKQVETGWLSFKWRNYDPAMGRFFNVDPLSEKYAYQSHYNFSENRVIDGIELEGLEFESFNDAREWAMENGWGIDIINEEFVLVAPEKEIEEVKLAGQKKEAKESLSFEDLEDLQGIDAPSLGITEPTIGSAIQDFRNASAPSFTGITGTVIKGFVDSALDAANLLRNVTLNKKNYSGLVPRMTGWDGWPLGGQEGLDQSVNGITFLGGLMTGGITSEVNAAKRTTNALPTLDSTGKVHGTLPKVKDLGKYSKEDLQILLKELRQSVQRRIEVTSKMGRDRGHGQRQGAEQDLIKSLEKYLDQ